MYEEEDTEDYSDVSRFPLLISDRAKVAKVIELVRDRLWAMEPRHIRGAASVLLALRRLPAVTPGIQVTFGFQETSTGGNYAWADIVISESEFRLGLGEHFYDPGIGGDTETRTVFEVYAGGNSREGDIDEWLPVASVIASEGEATAEDYSDSDSVDWASEEDAWQDEIEQSLSISSSSAPSECDPPDLPVSTDDQFRRIWEEAAGQAPDHLREQLAYRHMIALADTYEGWAIDKRMTREQSAKLVGWAEAMRTLADEVGPGWDPPTPEKLTLIGFLGRKALGE